MTTRRDFIQRASALAVLPLIPAISFESLAAAKVPLDDPAAKALRYVEDATLAKRADKMGVAAAEQVCSNCRFYITA
ncbi:MAG: iron permease, partial [Gammaproteobacteria bacterium TMED182]